MTTTCPTEERLIAWSETALSPSEARAIEAHVEGCSRCAAVCEELRTLDHLLAIPMDVDTDLRETLHAIPASVPSRRLPTRLLVGALSAAAVLLLAFSTPMLRDDEVRPTSSARSHPRPEVGPMDPAPTAAQPESAPRSAAVQDPVPSADLLATLRLPALHRMVREGSHVEARAALGQLATRGQRASLPVLLDALRSDALRTDALRALGAVADPRSAARIAPYLTSSAFGATARRALVQIGGEDAAAALAGALQQIADQRDSSEPVAPDQPPRPALLPMERALLAALGETAGRASIRTLGTWLDSRSAARARCAREVVAAHSYALAPALIAALHDSRPGEARAALRVAEVDTPPEVVPALAPLLDRRETRAQAALVLARLDTPAAVEILWRARPADEIRQAFRRAGPQTERWLLARFGDGDRRAQGRALDLLGFCGGTATVSALRRRMSDHVVAPQVLTVLGRLGSDAAVDALSGIAAEPRWQRRAIAALGMTGSVGAIAPLEALGRSDPALRMPAREALASIPAAAAVEAILRLDEGHRSLQRTERVLRGMDRTLVLSALGDLLSKEPPPSDRLVSTARRMQHAMGAVSASRAGVVAFN